MFVVFGATGNTGSQVAEALLSAGEKVRVFVRSADKGAKWKARGAEVAVGSVDDAKSVEAALTGVKGAYLLLPPDGATTDPLGKNAQITDIFAAALAKTKPERVVFLSSVGAQHEKGTGPIRALHNAEKKLKGPGVTFLRAAYFLDNWGMVLGAAKGDGVLPTFIPADQKIPSVSTVDIGKTAAKLLREGTKQSVVELAGAEETSPNDVAAALTKILGKPVKSLPLPVDQVVPTFSKFGLSTAISELYQEMYSGVASKHVSFESGQPLVRGTATLEATLSRLLA